MRKKLPTLLLIATAAACIMLGVAGCGPEENETAHEHTFSEEWTFDEEYHWHEAICGHDEVSGRAAHTFDGNACTVCGYEKQPEPCDEHVDEDGDGLCDVCGETMPEEPEPEPTEGLEYFSLVGGTYYTVTGIGTATDTNIVIPSEYKGKPVKKSIASRLCTVILSKT